MKAEFQKLLSDYASGQISADDFRRLQDCLLEDEQLRTEFLEYMNTCVFLEDTASYSESLFPESILQAPVPPPRPATKVIPFPHWALAAAAAVVIGLVTWFNLPAPAATGVPTRIIASNNAQIEALAQTLGSDDTVSLEHIELKDGWVRLELPRGVIFDLYGPAKGRFESNTRFHLDSGRLNVDVGPFGKGFTVVTANAEIVDLGTQFGVDVGEDFEAKVAVFSGEVEVHASENESGPRLLIEGEGVQVASSGRESRLMSINLPDEADSDSPRFSRASHFEISDNLGVNNTLRYYGIINGGMREGAGVYTTFRNVRWKRATGQAFPPELLGADLIQTFHKDRRRQQLTINLKVQEASAIYVMFDERYETPEWLGERFTDTGQVLVSGPWRPVEVVHDILPDPQGNFYVHHKVWRADLRGNESIELGESINQASPDENRAMYGIAIRSLDSIGDDLLALAQD